MERILELCAEAGAVSIGGICLHLRGEVRAIFMDWLRSYRPDLVPRYERLYARGAYAPTSERERLSRLVRAGRRAGGGWGGAGGSVSPDRGAVRPRPNRTGHEGALATDAAVDAEHAPMALPPTEQTSLF